MSRVSNTLIWLLISLAMGAAANWLFNLDFWLSSMIAGAALIVNGLVAEWEDRRE